MTICSQFETSFLLIKYKNMLVKTNCILSKALTRFFYEPKGERVILYAKTASLNYPGGGW